jgi:hypothetical protein
VRADLWTGLYEEPAEAPGPEEVTDTAAVLAPEEPPSRGPQVEPDALPISPQAAPEAAVAVGAKPLTLLLVARGGVWLHNVTLQGGNVPGGCRGLDMRNNQKVHADGTLLRAECDRLVQG